MGAVSESESTMNDAMLTEGAILETKLRERDARKKNVDSSQSPPKSSESPDPGPSGSPGRTMSTESTTKEKEKLLVSEAEASTNDQLDSNTTVAKNDKQEEEDEKTVWQVLDELIGIDPQKLRLIVQSSLVCLLLFAFWLTKRAYKQDNMNHVYLHSGFAAVIVCLSLSVEFVLAEAARITQKQLQEKAEKARKEKKLLVAKKKAASKNLSSKDDAEGEETSDDEHNLD